MNLKFVIPFLLLLTFVLPEVSQGDGIKEKLRNCILNEFEKGQVRVKIEGSEEYLASGRFKKIHIEARQFTSMAKLGEFFFKNPELSKNILNFSLPGLVMDEGIASLIEGKFDIEALREKGVLKILRLKEGRFCGTTSEKNLESFIQKQNPHFKDLQLNLLEGSAKISFKLSFLDIPVQMQGKFGLKNPSQVCLQDFKLRVFDIRVRALEDLVATTLNPIIDLKDEPFIVKIEKIEITPGKLKLAFSVKDIDFSGSKKIQ